MNLKEALARIVLLARDRCPVSNVKFDFLGYCFRPRRAKNSQNASAFCSFLPRLSASALKVMRAAIRDLNLRKRTHVSMADIARQLNPLLRAGIVYYGRFRRAPLGQSFDTSIRQSRLG